jgi:hypothetical protein
MFKNVVNDVLKSKTNKDLTKALLKEISNNSLEDDYGIVQIGKTTNTYERMKVLRETELSINGLIKNTSSVEKDFKKKLIIIDSILRHTQQSTVRYQTFITKMIKICLGKLSYGSDMTKVAKMFPNIAAKCKL